MHRYKLNLNLGVHHYGNIYRAENLENGQMYIIEEHNKKCNSWEECISIRQVKVLRVLNHPNIIKLKEIIRQDKELFLVFEYYETNLQQWYNDINDQKRIVSENAIKKIIYQIALAINQCHANGIMHRDLCPENIYINKGLLVKVGQFANAEFLKKQNYTEYVTTRWYRSPEAILRLQQSVKIDIWSLGCIMAELYCMKPFFPGQSELDQLMRILRVLGIPNHKEYPEFHTLCQQKEIKMPQIEGVGLQTILPQASPEAIDLMNQMLNVNPAKRISIQKVLQHPFFSDISQTSDQESVQIGQLIDNKIKLSAEEIQKQQESFQKSLAYSLRLIEKPSKEDNSDGGEKEKSDRSPYSNSPIRYSSDSPSNKTLIGRLSLFGKQNTPKNSNSEYNQMSQFSIVPDTKRSEYIDQTEPSEDQLSSERDSDFNIQDKLKINLTNLNINIEQKSDVDFAK